MNERVELLPCPFCGNAGQISYSDRGEIFSVRCVNWSGSVAPLGDDTPCMGSGAYGYTEDETIANWNRRAILPPPAGHWSDPKTFEEAPLAGDGMQPVPPYADVGFGSLLVNAAMANLKDYVFSPDEGSDHEPTEFERVLIEDWFMGLTSDTPVNDLIVKANAALFAASPHNAVPDGVAVRAAFYRAWVTTTRDDGPEPVCAAMLEALFPGGK